MGQLFDRDPNESVELEVVYGVFRPFFFTQFCYPGVLATVLCFSFSVLSVVKNCKAVKKSLHCLSVFQADCVLFVVSLSCPNAFASFYLFSFRFPHFVSFCFG